MVFYNHICRVQIITNKLRGALAICFICQFRYQRVGTPKFTLAGKEASLDETLGNEMCLPGKQEAGKGCFLLFSFGHKTDNTPSEAESKTNSQIETNKMPTALIQHRRTYCVRSSALLPKEEICR